MNTFEFVPSSKNHVRVHSMFDKIVFNSSQKAKFEFDICLFETITHSFDVQTITFQFVWCSIKWYRSITNLHTMDLWIINKQLQRIIVLLLVSISPFFENFSNCSRLKAVVLSVIKPASMFSILFAPSLVQETPFVQKTPFAPITLKLWKIYVKSILNSISELLKLHKWSCVHIGAYISV